MQADAREFTLTPLERVISGPGSAASLGGELARYGARRAIVVTGRTLGASPLLRRLTEALGTRCAAVFDGARQHVPARTVCDLVAVIRSLDADALVSFGGGSPIDTAKAAVYELLSRDAGSAVPVHVAVPTTLSAAEFTAIAGITDDATRIKRAVVDRRLAPRAVIADPTLTLETPDWLWAATGMRAVDHAIETLYGVRSHPLSEAAAAKGLGLLLEHLPASKADRGRDVVWHREQCQAAAWLAIFGLPTAGLGLSHALGHQIGPRWNVPHGITSCITLPHAMRHMARRWPERFAPIAAALGVAFDGADPGSGALACAGRIERFIEELSLPRRLSEAGVSPDGFDDLADVVYGELARAHGPQVAVTRSEVLSLLMAAA